MSPVQIRFSHPQTARLERAFSWAHDMTIPRDKAMHVAMGAATAIGVLALLFVAARFGPPAAMIAGAVAVGCAYEGVQKLRGEGVVEFADVLATAAGGLLLTGALIAAGLI